MIESVNKKGRFPIILNTSKSLTKSFEVENNFVGILQILICTSIRASTGHYAGAIMVLQATAKKDGRKIHEVGDISITDDGSLIYFVYPIKYGPSN